MASMLFFALLMQLFLQSSAYAADGIVASIPEQKLVDVANSMAWKRLMHYEPATLGGIKSELDGEGFFFAADGRKNPLSELKASINGMYENRKMGKLELQPPCAFPERYRFLVETFGLTPRTEKTEKCEKFDEFMARFNDPQALSVIFSSAYPNNPASLFGHSFLKVTSKAHTDLLDMGVNFAAYVPKGEGGAAFIWFGATGGYHGSWSIQPYYVKVYDYSDFESRDLWEYELSLTPEETRRLLAHLWEMETNTYFNYYFFDENCSYQILRAIEAIKPEWRLSQHNIYVVPGETIKNLNFAPGVVRKVNYRPSFHHRLFQRYDSLTSSERKEFFKLIDGEMSVQDSHNRFVLDTVASYYDYIRPKMKDKYEEEIEPLRKKLLSHRASLGPTSAEELARLPALAGTTRPDLGHDSYTQALSTGTRDFGKYKDDRFTGYRIKSSYHDLLNNDLGYNRYAQLDGPQLEFQHDEANKRIRLESFNLLTITSLSPVSFIDNRISWKYSTGLFTARDYGCLDCKHAFIEGGLGSSFDFSEGRHLLYGLVGARGEFYHRLERGYRSGPHVDLGLLLNPWAPYKFRLQWLTQWNLSPDLGERINTFRFEHSYSLARNWEIRNSNYWQSSSKNRQQEVREFRLELLHFFN
jgi:hypothetical protein